MMTRSRSKESLSITRKIPIFAQASQEATNNSPQAQAATKRSPDTPSSLNGAADVVDVATSVGSAGKDRNYVTPETITMLKSPASGQINIPQGIQPYDESAPVLANGYGHDIHEFYFKREVI